MKKATPKKRPIKKAAGKPVARKKVTRKKAVRKKPTGKKPTLPAVPSDLSGPVAERIWRDTEPRLRDRLNLLDIDQSILVLYCNTWQLLHDAETALAKEGRYITMPTGYVARHPAAIDQKDAMGQIRRLASELGMTPKSGRRVKVRTGDGDMLKAFLSGTNNR